MTTERDVYEIDTKTAVANVNELAKAMDTAGKEATEQKSAMQEVSGFLEGDLRQAVFSAQAAYGMLTSAMRSVVDFTKEGVHNFLEAEQANMRLAAAVKRVGGASDELLQALQKQNSALQRATGVDDDYLTGLQALMVSMGVAPEKLGEFTDAAMRLSQATGTDARMAVLQLARAHAEGREDLKKYGIEVSDAEFELKGFDATLEAVRKQFPELNDTIPETVRQTNELKGAWSDLQEAVGGAAVRLVETKDGANGLARVLDWLTEKVENLNSKSFALKAVLPGLLNPFLIVPGMMAAGGELLTTEAKAEAEKAKLELAQVEVTVGEIVVKGRELSAERKRAMERAIADRKRYNEEMEKISSTSHANLARMEEEENRKLLERVQAQGDWEKLQHDEELRAAQQLAEDRIAILKSEEEQRQQIRDRQLEQEKQFWDNLKSFARGSLESMVQSQVQFLSQMLMDNTEFNRQMFELELERKTAGMEEAEVQKKRAEMEKQLARERGAAYLKMTADALMSIAQQASVKAVMEGVEAIAALAMGNAAGAALHGTAAAGYAGVAVLAGGTAAVLSSARGMTTDERKSLEAARENAKEREKKEKAQRGEARAVEAGTVVNVYNLGITGQTEAEQAKELERIRSKFAEMRTGSGG